MKAHLGFIDLIFIITLMAASIPLLSVLIRVTNNSKMDYLSDKTVYKISDSIEWVTYNNNGNTVMVPSTLAPISIDYGGAQVIALINDNFCPDDGKTIYYAYETGSIHAIDVKDGNAKLEITDGWDTDYLKGWSNQLGSVVNGNTVTSLKSQYQNDKCYLVWSSAYQKWFITTKFINIFEEKIK